MSEKATPFYDELKRGVPEAYPERTDRRIAIIEVELSRLRDEVEYLRPLRDRVAHLEQLVHRYINQDEAK